MIFLWSGGLVRSRARGGDGGGGGASGSTRAGRRRSRARRRAARFRPLLRLRRPIVGFSFDFRFDGGFKLKFGHEGGGATADFDELNRVSVDFRSVGFPPAMVEQPVVWKQIVVRVCLARYFDDFCDAKSNRFELRRAQLVRSSLRMHSRSV